MLASEYARFCDEMQAVAAVMRSKSLNDIELRTYWNALKDRPLEDVLRRLGERAKRNKFMPRPAELRPKDEEKPEASATAEAAYRHASEYNAESWRLLRAEDPVRFSIEYRVARASRMLVTLSERDAVRSSWLSEDQYWSMLRLASRAEQERAVTANPLIEWRP